MKIGVYGSASSGSSSARAKARQVGEYIARAGYTLITGACPGLPYEAVRGAAEQGGACLGYSPAVDLDGHRVRFHYPTEGFTRLIFIPRDYVNADVPAICKKYRNLQSVAAVDAAVIVGGGIGTMNEFTLAYAWGRPIAVLEDTGGITSGAVQALLQAIDAGLRSRVLFGSDPEDLLGRLLRIRRQESNGGDRGMRRLRTGGEGGPRPRAES